MSYLMNSSEILQTIRMIDQQHLDVRIRHDGPLRREGV